MDIVHFSGALTSCGFIDIVHFSEVWTSCGFVDKVHFLASLEKIVSFTVIPANPI